MEKFSELEKLEMKDLKDKVLVLRKESLNLRFQKSSGQLEKTARISQVRKQIARMTVEKLIADGRIHPAKIEEFHDKSKAELESRLRELGEKAQMEIGIHGLHPEVLKMLGALNYRTSYMQNQYQHSLEVGFLCGAMAAELGMNVKQARRAGLLHDIGKAIDASAEGSHAVPSLNPSTSAADVSALGAPSKASDVS